MESAEHELLRSLEIAVLPPRDTQPRLTWPRVAASCDYHSAAHFEDQLQVAVMIEKIGGASVRYRFEFKRDEHSIATGHLTTVCCTLGDDGLAKVTIPDQIRQKLQSV